MSDAETDNGDEFGHDSSDVGDDSHVHVYQDDTTTGPGPVHVESTRTKKLMLLDLPVDILRMIVQEVSHVSDLTSMARTHTILHALAIPPMYARFDIIWPETRQGPSDDSKSVDALTFGLSTLCLGSSFAYRTQQLHQQRPGPLSPPGRARARAHSITRLRRSDYAKFTRKFALGNGPPDLVSDYLISKEAGKMLGTLVALAIQRMTNLEVFFWDMPTGVLSDVFLALASLQDNSPDGSCKLREVWVRCHRNADLHGTLASPSSGVFPTGLTLIGFVISPSDGGGGGDGGGGAGGGQGGAAGGGPAAYQQCRVEYPNFSVLPPLKTLTVLDIDELEYLDEMAILIARSQPLLRELRVGISAEAVAANSPFVQTWDGAGLHQVDRNSSWPGQGTIGIRRLGGVLGVLVGHVFDLRAGGAEEDAAAYNDCVDRKLHLQSLELERIPLSVRVCCEALDWSTLTSLTLLQCPLSDRLWKALRRQFRPWRWRTGSGGRVPHEAYQYQLCLKKLHTDVPSMALMGFLTGALAPNTLEVLFLQDRPPTLGRPVVPVQSIFRGPIRRHRSSLEKVLLDSSDVNCTWTDNSLRWRNWIPTTEMLLWMTSGRMPKLRELAIHVSYKDWHPFLQRLPNMPRLRSLNIPAIADHVFETVEPKELALQITDIVSLRPEMQLCYVGIHEKCFEIIETRQQDDGQRAAAAVKANSGQGTTSTGNGPGGDEDDGEAVVDDDDDQDSDDGTGGGDFIDGEVEEDGSSQAESFDHDDDDDDDGSSLSSFSSFSEPGQHAGVPRFGLREILFYDYKVDIFKARHGKL